VLPAERHGLISEALRSAQVVSTEELARRLGVSAETVRRDLVALERQGALRRVHGGATAGSPFATQEASFADRSALALEAKQAIGRLAAGQVSAGQTIVLDVGTTALEVARALPLAFRGTVATCSLLAAAELAGRRDVEVLVSGGRVRGGDLAMSNATAVAFFAGLHADVAFLGSGCVDASAGLTDFHLDEVATRRVIIANSARSYILADSTKFDRVAPHHVCGLADVNGLITDSRPSQELDLAIKRAGGVVLAAA